MPNDTTKTDLYAIYLTTTMGAAIDDGDHGVGSRVISPPPTAPELLAMRLGQQASAKDLDDRLTVEATIAALNGTGRGFDAETAAAYLKVCPMPTSGNAYDQAAWLARAVQALGALPAPAIVEGEQ